MFGLESFLSLPNKGDPGDMEDKAILCNRARTFGGPVVHGRKRRHTWTSIVQRRSKHSQADVRDARQGMEIDVQTTASSSRRQANKGPDGRDEDLISCSLFLVECNIVQRWAKTVDSSALVLDTLGDATVGNVGGRLNATYFWSKNG